MDFVNFTHENIFIDNSYLVLYVKTVIIVNRNFNLPKGIIHNGSKLPIVHLSGIKISAEFSVSKKKVKIDKICNINCVL